MASASLKNYFRKFQIVQISSPDTSAMPRVQRWVRKWGAAAAPTPPYLDLCAHHVQPDSVSDHRKPIASVAEQIPLHAWHAAHWLTIVRFTSRAFPARLA
jgi:hypothetical protein